VNYECACQVPHDNIYDDLENKLDKRNVKFF
jgi:hypothetical protein